LTGKWIIERDFDTVVSKISRFECAEVVLVIKSLRIEPDFVIFGCYIPTVPRLTSVLSGRILVHRVSENQTQVQAISFLSWADPFIKSLIENLQDQENTGY
jgi:hypothetical protein